VVFIFERDGQSTITVISAKAGNGMDFYLELGRFSQSITRCACGQNTDVVIGFAEMNNMASE
jgi:hypothetical protein